MALQITINAQCTPSPNGSGANGAVLSKSSANGKSNQVTWKAAKACVVTVPAGYFVDYASQQLVITFTQAGDSSTYTLLSTATVGDMDYTITGCSTSGPPDPPMIEIDA